MRIVLQADHIQRGVTTLAHIDQRDAARRQQALGLQLFTAQADHHDFAAEVRVQTDVAQRAYGHDGVRCVNRDAAAVGMFE